MAIATHDYRPDYAVSPGSVLAERLAAHGMSQAELARRCGRSPKLISEIVGGKASLEPETALQLERVLDVGAHIWLGMEADYRLHETRLADEEQIRSDMEWGRRFPLKEMAERGLIAATNGPKAMSDLLSFFGVASVQAWQNRYERMAVVYRHSPSFKSDRNALAAWLREAETRASEQPCAAYDGGAFRDSLKAIRRLTREPVRHALSGARELCNSAGVALAVVKPFFGMRVSGAGWWPSAVNPVIALTARHKTNDQLWFSMFHEAAHVLRHGKRRVFVDGPKTNDDATERQADQWAANFLIPRSAWRRFVERGDFRSTAVDSFASEQGIAPGIVVGRLQHEGRASWNSRLNSLKVRLRWAGEPD